LCCVPHHQLSTAGVGGCSRGIIKSSPPPKWTDRISRYFEKRGSAHV